MKKYFLIPLLFSVLIACNSQEEEMTQEEETLNTSLINNPASADSTAPVGDLPAIRFSEMEHDFGVIHDGEKVTHEFEFENTGKAPLLVTKAQASCGCTATDFPTEPLAPGAKGSIKVKFDATNKEGLVTKTVAVYSNDPAGVTNLSIKADVKK